MDYQKFKLCTLAVFSALRPLPNLPLIFALVFLLSHCGKGGGPSAPAPIGAPSAPAEESALPTAISGRVESLAVEGVGGLVVEMVDEEGSELARDLTREDGTFKFSVPVKPSQKQFLIRAGQKGETLLTASVEITAGEDRGNLILNPVSHLSVIFAGGGVDRDGLKSAQNIEKFIQTNLSQAEIEQISQEIRNLTMEQIVSDFLNTNAGGRNAINKFLEKIYPSDSSLNTP